MIFTMKYIQHLLVSISMAVFLIVPCIPANAVVTAGTPCTSGSQYDVIQISDPAPIRTTTLLEDDILLASQCCKNNGATYGPKDKGWSHSFTWNIKLGVSGTVFKVVTASLEASLSGTTTESQTASIAAFHVPAHEKAYYGFRNYQLLVSETITMHQAHCRPADLIWVDNGSPSTETNSYTDSSWTGISSSAMSCSATCPL
jgi:hypothetical protein